MKSITKNKKQMIVGLALILILLIGFVAFRDTNKLNKAHAATAPYNNSTSNDGVRIDGWRLFANMTTYGENIDNGCGMTAIAQLLQYYNDNTRFSGEILPDEFNYRLHTGTDGLNANANALREHIRQNTPSGLGVAGELVGRISSQKTENATVPHNQKDGLNNFFNTYNPNLNVNAHHRYPSSYGSDYDIVYKMYEDAKRHIDENRPIIITMLNYNETSSSDVGNGFFIKGDAHTAVAYGYRERGGMTEFLAHAGWGNGTEEIWFSQKSILTFLYGFVYIDAPLSRYNYTVLDNNLNGAVRIDGLKYQHSSTLVIPSRIDGLNVTQINVNAFDNQTGITELSFENGSQLQTIGNSAFANCTSLNEVYIPSSVTSIGNYAFYGCSGLSKVIFENGSQLQSIGEGAFNWCSSLSSFTIPDNVSSIESFTFKDCFSLSSITIPNSVTSIGTQAFYNCYSLSAITLPNSVTSIGNSAFIYCTALLDITIPASVTSIDNYAFASCINLKNITIQNGLTSIGSYAFNYCTRLENIVIPDSVTSIGDNAFRDCIRLERVELGYGIVHISDETFYGCEKLSSIILPDGLWTIGTLAFYGCTSLTNIKLGDFISKIDYGAFYNCSSLSGIILPINLTLLGDYVFYGCTSLTTVEYAKPLSTVNAGTFYGCTNLTSILLYANTTNIKTDAFKNCNNLKIIYFNRSDTSPVSFGSGIFPSTPTIHYYSAEQPTTLGFYWKYENNLPVAWPPALFTYSLINNGTAYAVSVINGRTLVGEVTIPSTYKSKSVKAIANSAFAGQAQITRVNLPDSITTIENYAFGACSALENINFPFLLESINSYAFSYCTSLKDISILNGTKSIGLMAFNECISLESISVHPKNTVFRSEGNCLIQRSDNTLILGCKNSVIPSSLTSIGVGAFAGCHGLEYLALMQNSNITNIGDYAFENCINLKFLMLANVTNIGTSAFYNCNSLETIESLVNVRSIGYGAFANCTSLGRILIMNTTYIDNYAFYNCNNLTIYLEKGDDLVLQEVYWNPSNRPVFSMCVLSYYKDYIISLKKLENFNSGNGTATSIPNNPGYIFGGWINESTRIIYSQDQIGTAPNGIYSAIWTIQFVRITFDLAGGKGSFPSLSVSNGTAAVKPESIPTKDGHSFEYWALSTNLSQKYDWTTPVTQDIKLVACWKVVPPPPQPTAGLSFRLVDNNTAYEVSKGTANINETVIIQSTYEGLPVVRIAANGFANCTNLKDITIPPSVTSVGQGAFSNTGIWNSSANNSVVYADKWAVGYKGTLGDISLNASTLGIAEYAFQKCGSLTSITISASVISIGNYAFYYCSNITSIDIPASVTSIGNDAFSQCSSLSTVNVGANSKLTSIGNYAFSRCSSLSTVNVGANSKLASIGNNAFYYCTKLTSIAIPASVTSIGNYAFYQCTSLAIVTFGANSKLASIGDNAFYYCTKLTSIAIPASVTSIGDNAFYYCSNITSISAETGNAIYISEGNCLIRRSDNTLILGCKNSVIPSYVTHIGNAAFYGSALTSINIPNSVIAIGNAAFYSSALASIDIPNSVTTIGNNAFFYCNNLTSITIPSGTTNIATNSFQSCSNLSSISVASGNPVYTSENNCLIRKGDNTLMLGCKNSVIPSYIENIGNYAFYNAGLTSINLPNSIISIGDYAFYNTKFTSINLPNSITSIGDYAFYNLSLASISIPDNIVSIGRYAFSNCSKLTNATIGNGLVSIGDSAFSGCIDLSTVTFAEGSSLATIGSSAFSNCYKLTEIIILDSVTSLGDYAFSGCSNLSTVIFAEGSSLTTIGSSAFSSCYKLTKITIPDSVTSLGDSAFYDCTNLSTVIFAEGSSLTTIGAYAFACCYKLQNIVLPDSLTTIGASAFAHCYKIQNIVLPDSLTTIESEAFAYCRGLSEIIIPSNVTYIGNSAFRGWGNHQTIYISEPNRDGLWVYGEDNNWTEYWSEYWDSDSSSQNLLDFSLSGTPGLEFNLIYDDEGNEFYEVFAGNSLYEGHSFIFIPEFYEGIPVTRIADHAFDNYYNYYGGTDLLGIVIPDSITDIGAYAFANCNKLSSVIFKGESRLKSIGCYAFRNCYNLTDIRIYGDNATIHEYAFAGCYGLENLSILGNVTYIEDSILMQCYSLKTITLSAGIEYISYNAFADAYGYTVYSEASYPPNDWYFIESSYDYCIIWNCTLSEDNSYIVSLNGSENNLFYNELYMPYRKGYMLDGWTTIEGSDEREYDPQDGCYTYDTVLYAIWIPSAV